MHKPSSEQKPVSEMLYRSYMLRLWAVQQPDGKSWYASLQDPHTGERIGFACLEELFAFLMDQATGSDSCTNQGTEEG